MKAIVRPATAIVTVVIALNAVFAAATPSVSGIAARRMVTASPHTLVDSGAQVASRRLVS